jgi:hypothetical protein
MIKEPEDHHIYSPERGSPALQRVITAVAIIAVVVAALWAVAALSATFTGPGTDDQGNSITWTLTEQITPARLYVAANGSDTNNNCKTQTAPCLTVAKINSMLLSRGGSVLFRGGDTFTGNLVPNIDGNGDPANPLTIGSYGTGNATLVGGATGETGVINIDGMSGVVVQNLNIRGPSDLTKMPRAGIRIANSTSTVRSNIVIQNVDVGGICYFQATAPAGGQGTDGFEIEIAGYPGAGLDTISILNSKLHGLNGPGSCDDTGIGGFGNGININNVHVKNVEVYNLGGGPPGLAPGLAYPPMGDGIEADGWSNSLVEFNTAHDLGANYRNAGGGPAGFLSASTINVTFSRNEAHHIAPSDFSLVQVDFVGFDCDNASQGCVIDSNYSHDNYNSGFMLFSNGDCRWNNNTITNNISQNDQRGGLPGFGGIAITMNGSCNPTISVQNNTTFNNLVYSGQLYQNSNQGASGISVSLPGIFAGTISKNIAVSSADIYGYVSVLNARTNTATFTPSADISNNAWFPRTGGLTIWWANTQYFTVADWQAASGKGANTQTNDPQFSAPGTGPAGYTHTLYPGWGATPQASYGIAP